MKRTLIEWAMYLVVASVILAAIVLMNWSFEMWMRAQ